MASEWIMNPVTLIPAAPGWTAAVSETIGGEPTWTAPIVGWAVVEEVASDHDGDGNSVLVLREGIVPHRFVEPVLVIEEEGDVLTASQLRDQRRCYIASISSPES